MRVYPREQVTTIVDEVGVVANILVDMIKAFNSTEYCEGINKYNVRGIYRSWATGILEAISIAKKKRREAEI
jgi:hypothetical protein